MIIKDTPKLLFSTITNGIIWRIKVDYQKQILAFEVRSTDKKVCFYAYNFESKTTLIHNFSFDEQWLIGLDHIEQNIAYFHSFENEFSPVHKGIIAFDLIQQKIVWQNFSLSVHQFTTDGIISFESKIFPRKYQLVNFKTGSKIASVSTENLYQFKSHHFPITLPEIILGNTVWETKSVLNTQDVMIEASYQNLQNKINQIIRVFKKGSLVFTDFLNQDIQKPSEDTFMMWLDKLIYIRNKSEILTYLV